MCEYLYRGFSTDIQGRIEIDVFLSTLAVLKSKDISSHYKFIFRVYDGGSGIMTRGRTEEILQLAYGDKIKQYYDIIMNMLDELFPRRRKELTLRDFEQWRGELNVLMDWIIHVLNVFMEFHPKRILSLH